MIVWNCWVSYIYLVYPVNGRCYVLNISLYNVFLGVMVVGKFYGVAYFSVSCIGWECGIVMHRMHRFITNCITYFGVSHTRWYWITLVPRNAIHVSWGKGCNALCCRTIIQFLIVHSRVFCIHTLSHRDKSIKPL